MYYSQEDLDMLAENYRQIEKYVKENYVPLLEDSETVTVVFGESDKCSFSFDKEACICFCGHQVQFGTRFPGTIDIYQCPEYGDELCFHWDSVKLRIQAYFDRKKKKKEAIRNFRV